MTTLITVLVMALLLANTTVWSSRPPDQYKAREDEPQTPRRLHGEATDHQLDADIKKQDLHQVISKQSRRTLQKRSYTPWAYKTLQADPYESISIWRPQTYPLSRPYFIPIFGVPGRIPIYFPPQPLYINPGVPPNNPQRPFKGPTYLPPQPTTAAPPTKMTVANKFGGNDDMNYFDGQPVWGDRPLTTQAPPPPAASNNGIRPTRRPPPSTSTHPPLQHRPIRNNTSAGSSPGSTKAPPNNNYIPPPSQSQAPARPQQDSQRPGPGGPTSCVWAIISCCSAAGQISYECFEQRGCPGAFWDKSPCESDFARAAISNVLNYYESKK